MFDLMASAQPHSSLAEARRQAIISIALAALLAAIVLLTLLGHNRLTDWDEGIYAQVSREMLSTGYLVPHWNTQLWLEKPPLTFWITALFFRLFGVSEFTARLGSALAGVATITLLHAWLTLRPLADRVSGRLTAWLSTLILLTTFGYLHIARVGETDTLLAFGCLLALIGLSEVQRGRLRAWHLFWLGFAIALLSKGAASGAIGLTLVALAPFLYRSLRRDFFLGLLLFLALVLPWHLYMLHRFGDLFLQQYLGLHVIGRATTQLEGHLTRWWFYLWVLLVSAPPYVLLYPFALVSGLRLSALRPFAVFALIEVLAFSLIQTRLPHYIAPTYAPFAILVAVWLVTHIPLLSVSTRQRLQFVLAAVALWLLAAFLTGPSRKALHSPRLPNGDVTPNNREQVALLKQVFQHPSPAVAAIPGPLLVWRQGHDNPIPTVVFYASRPVQQIEPQPLPPGSPTDIYSFNPVPFIHAIGSRPSLLLVDRSLLSQLPAGYSFTPIATSPTLALGTIAQIEPTSRLPAVDPKPHFPVHS